MMERHEEEEGDGETRGRRGQYLYRAHYTTMACAILDMLGIHQHVQCQLWLKRGS